MSQETVEERYAYSRCMTLVAAVSKPARRYHDDNFYIGPQALLQVRLFNVTRREK